MQNKLKSLLVKVGLGGVLAVGVGLMIASVAHADGRGGGKGHGGRGGHGRGMPPAADLNNDGSVDDAERKAFRAKMLVSFDKNGDGQLDESERQAMREAKLAERFGALDANKDKVLSWDEFKADRGHGRGHGPPPGAAGPAPSKAK